MMRTQIVLVLVYILAASSLISAGDCRPYWKGVESPLGLLTGSGSLKTFDDGTGAQLYATGHLPGIGDGTVARWDGQSWEIIDDGLPERRRTGPLQHFYVDNELSLYVWVWPRDPAEATLWRWEGTEWVLPRPGFVGPNHEPRISFHDGEQWVTYGTVTIVPNSRDALIRWNGATWVQVHPNLTVWGFYDKFAAFDSGQGAALHVTGSYGSIGGVPMNHITMFDGKAFRSLGAGISANRGPMIVHDEGGGPGLYIADVTTAGGQLVDRMARWDGEQWSNIGGGGIHAVGMLKTHALSSYDDGTAPNLIVGGYMSVVGSGIMVRGIARYRDGVWDDMQGGVRSIGWSGGIASAFAEYDYGNGPSLFVGGGFNTVGAGEEGATYGIAEWVGCHNQCYANCTRSTTEPRLTVNDFTCFINKFAHGDPYVDCNQDGVRDIADFHCFIARFAEGCP